MSGLIGGVSGYSNYYNAYGNTASAGNFHAQGAGSRPEEVFFTDKSEKDGSVKKVFGTGEDEKVSGEKCQTCAKRKYKDGSDENVSFKSAAHISPEAAASAVRAHEGEHVSNAYTSAAQNGGKVVSASVSIHMAVCPECGKSYVSGGTTSTQIKYPSDPYTKSQKALLDENAKGNNIDYAA